jgi:glucose/arabinose dehydrogenase
VSLTRAATAGMFNGVTETSFAKFASPADTEWAVGSLSNFATLSYSDWTTTGGGHPVLNYVGEQLVVHLISDDIYLSLQFTALDSTGAGGFSYIRSTPTPANVPPTVAIVSPTNGASFTSPANIFITATATNQGGSVTNVTFFDGSTFLGGTNNPPYTIAASLATGSHALTAVAASDLGLSATSAVVNVTVNVQNSPISVSITNPPDNAIFGNTDTVTVEAAVSDTGGSVTNVQFFDGAAVLRSFSTAPYRLSTTFPLGSHTLTAMALDNLGNSATSAPVHVVVARYLPTITNGEIGIFLEPVATGLSAPDYAVSPPGDSNRLFVVEQNGLLRIIQNGILLPTPALDIQSRVQPPLVATNANDERGFLGLAFHPGFNNPASPGFRTLYTYNSETIPSGTLPTYPVPTTATNTYRNVVNEWKISSTNDNVVDLASRREIISFGKNAANHNGGTIAFGPDGYVYLGLGDGGNANDVGPSHIEPGGNAQNLSTPLGKMLRFDPLNPALNPGSTDSISSNGQYRIPAGNPFQGSGQVPEIYAYGLRNPYRFSFDTANGDLIQADVGQNNVEEIDRIILGGNYGWAIKEGDFLFNRTNGPAGNAGTIGAPPGNRSPGSPAGLIDPISGTLGILEYDHNEGISITGGFVYRGSAIPELYGKYVFGDLALIPSPVRVNGRLFYADLQTGLIKAFPLPQFGGSAILPNGLTVHGFGKDASGELYALVTNTSAAGTGGVVYKLVSLRLKTAVSGNTLGLSWPMAAGHLQAQTNRLGTNWLDLPNPTGTNFVVVPIDPTNGSVFFRLVFP